MMTPMMKYVSNHTKPTRSMRPFGVTPSLATKFANRSIVDSVVLVARSKRRIMIVFLGFWSLSSFRAENPSHPVQLVAPMSPIQDARVDENSPDMSAVGAVIIPAMTVMMLRLQIQIQDRLMAK
jgi:hypothetical protein